MLRSAADSLSLTFALSRVRHDISVGRIVARTLEADLQLTDAALGHALDPQSDSAARGNKAFCGVHWMNMG